MPDILVRGVDVSTLSRLKARAKRHGRSMQSELRQLLGAAAAPSLDELLKEARRWRGQLGRRFGDSARLIREDRER